MEARARLIQQVSITARAVGIGSAAAALTDRTGIRRYLRVQPEAVQWLVPGDVLTYTVESNTSWILT